MSSKTTEIIFCKIIFISGSYTHHDFLPWDDDVDLRVSIRDRELVYNFLHQELGQAISMSNITDEYGNYDKLYFPWTPQAGTKNWSYPYIDLFYFDQNSTHIWRTNYDRNLINECSMSKSDVFPLVWRPFGHIWLPVSVYLNFLKSNLFYVSIRITGSSRTIDRF